MDFLDKKIVSPAYARVASWRIKWVHYYTSLSTGGALTLSDFKGGKGPSPGPSPPAPPIFSKEQNQRKTMSNAFTSLVLPQHGIALASVSARYL